MVEEEEDEAKERGERLHTSETFLKAKRNALFWSSVLFVLALAHAQVAVGLSVSGATLAMAPKLLVFLVLLTAAYHQWAFWYETGWVQWRHSKLAKSEDAAVNKQRAAAINAKVEQLIDSSPELAQLESAVQAVSLNASINHDAALDTKRFAGELKPAVENASFLAREFQRMAATGNADAITFSILGDIATQMDELSIKLNEASVSTAVQPENITTSRLFGQIDLNSAALRREVKEAIVSLNTFREGLDERDVRMFRYHHVRVPWLVFVVAFMVAVIDIAVPGGVGLRVNAVFGAESCVFGEQGCPKINASATPRKF